MNYFTTKTPAQWAQQLGLLVLIGASAPLETLAETALPTVEAKRLDCAKMKDKLLADLRKIKTDDEKIKSDLCSFNFNSEATGAPSCIKTYTTINDYSKQLEDKADEVCKLVDQAKTMACDPGQVTCLRDQSAIDKQTAVKLNEFNKILAHAKSDLKKAQKQDRKDAAVYKGTVKSCQDFFNKAKADVDKFKAEHPALPIFASGPLPAYLGGGSMSVGTPPVNYDDMIDKALVTITLGNRFGSKGPQNCKDLLRGTADAKTNWWPFSFAGYDKIDQNLNNYYTAWDNTDAKLGGDPGSADQAAAPAAPQPAAPSTVTPKADAKTGGNLERYSQEMFGAGTTALDGIKFTAVTTPQIEKLSTAAQERAATLDTEATRLGAADPDSGLSGGGMHKDPSLGAEAANASRTLSAANEGIPNPSGGGATSSTGASKAVEGMNKGGSAASPGTAQAAGNILNGTGTLPGGASNMVQIDPANDTVGNKENSSEVLGGNFGSLGAVTIGSDAEYAKLAGSSVAAKGVLKGGAGGGGAISWRGGSSTGKDESGKDDAHSGDVAATVAGGFKGALHTSLPSADDKKPFKLGSDSMSLRELLRKRLADRARGGGDTDASLAAEAALDEAAERGERARGEGSMAPGAESEQAGPQAMESEPLFTRVHNAHHRFQLREFPRAAEI